MQRPERIYSNCLPFTVVPEVVRRYRFSRPVYASDVQLLNDHWAFRRVDDRLALAFGPPPELPLGIKVKEVGSSLWASNPKVNEINSSNLAAELLRKSLQVELLRRGLQWTPDGRALFFPEGLLEKDQIRFTSYSGKPTFVTVGGERTIRGASFKYRMGLALSVRRDVIDEFALLVKLRVFLLDPEGKPVDATQIPSIRKKVTKSWFNHEFLSRHLAVACFLADGGEEITLDCGSSASICLSPQSLGGELSVGIDDEFLKRAGCPEAELPEDEDDWSGEGDE